MGFSLQTNLAIIVLLTSVIYGCHAEWTITPSHPFALSGKEFNLTCETGSQPTAFFTWYRNKSRIRLYTSGCEYRLTNKSLKYEFFCTSMTSFTVTIPAKFIDDEHGILWQCSGDTILNPVMINVLHEPDRNLTLTGYNGSILRLEQNLTLECISIGGRPWASLSWNCGGTPMQGSVSNSSDNVVSELILHLNETFSGRICTCQATHLTWETPVEKHTFPLQVYYASTKAPTITGYKTLQGIREGEKIKLTCTVLGGYPLPSLTWICGGTIMDSLNQSTVGVAKTVLPLSINRTYHEKQCFCNGTSQADYSRTSNVSFIVLYPPTVTVISNKELLPNRTNYSMFCQVDEGNPTSYFISWSQIFSNTVIRTNRDLANLQTNNGSSLTLTGLSYQDIGMYMCSVHNNVTDIHGHLLQNKSVTIQRNFSAVFVSSKVFKAIYGKRFDVRIPFYCQPAVKSIEDLSWFKKDNNENLTEQNSDSTFTLLKAKLQIPFYRTDVTVDGQVAVMTINVVRKTSEGSFLLRVRNMEDVYGIYEFKIEAKNPVNNSTLTGDKDQQTSIIVGSCVAVVVFIIIVIVYVVLKRRTSKGKDEKQRLSRDIAGNRESYQISNHYANIAEFNENKQIGGPSRNPYSEPSNVTPDDLPIADISPYAETRIVEKSGSDAVNNDHIPIATVYPYAKTHIVPKPCTGPVNNGFVQKENADTENKPGPIYAEVNKQKKIVNTNSELGAAKDSSDSQKDDIKDVKKPDPVYAEAKKRKPSEKKEDAFDSKEQAEKVSEVVAAKDSNDAQKDDVKKPDPMYSEAKKPKPSEKKDDAFDRKDRTEQVSEVGAAKDSNDVHKDNIKTPDPVSSVVYKQIHSEKKDEALDSKDQTDQDLIVAENNKFIDAVDQDGNRSDSRSDVVPNSTSVSTVNDTVVECEEETKNELNYVELDLSQPSDQKSEIISKGEKVEYAEVKTMA